MLFQKEHIEQIRNGEKTVTRRDWRRRQAREGGVYIASTEMFTSHEEADCYIQVTDVYQEQLGEMDDRDAEKEGGYTLEEFQRLWEYINGEPWDPEKEVYVVEFEYVGPNRPSDHALDRAEELNGRIRTGSQVMESRLTGNVYEVSEWVELHDGKAVSMDKELVA